MPIHRATAAAREAASIRDSATLPSAHGGPPVDVAWTVTDPLDRTIPDPADRRRAVVERLVAEAADQGAEPTDDDLAAALGVSRRTILCDAEILAAAGRPLGTRRRSRA